MNECITRSLVSPACCRVEQLLYTILQPAGRTRLDIWGQVNFPTAVYNAAGRVSTKNSRSVVQGMQNLTRRLWQLASMFVPLQSFSGIILHCYIVLLLYKFCRLLQASTLNISRCLFDYIIQAAVHGLLVPWTIRTIVDLYHECFIWLFAWIPLLL